MFEIDFTNTIVGKIIDRNIWIRFPGFVRKKWTSPNLCTNMPVVGIVKVRVTFELSMHIIGMYTV